MRISFYRAHIKESHTMKSNTTLEIQLKRKWYQIHFTSEKSATIYKFNPKTKSINDQGGPLFNCKINHLSEGWFLFLVRDNAAARSIWPLVKDHLDTLEEIK